MKPLSIFGITVAVLFAVAISASPNQVRLSFDSTTICVPKQYLPGLSMFGVYLQSHVGGFDESGIEEIIRLPASLIMQGVPGYEFSHINRHNVDLEHEISGVATNLSNVGRKISSTECSDEYDLGSCHQSLVFKGVFYSYKLQTAEQERKIQVQEYLRSLFSQWEESCTSKG